MNSTWVLGFSGIRCHFSRTRFFKRRKLKCTTPIESRNRYKTVIITVKCSDSAKSTIVYLQELLLSVIQTILQYRFRNKLPYYVLYMMYLCQPFNEEPMRNKKEWKQGSFTRKTGPRINNIVDIERKYYPLNYYKDRRTSSGNPASIVSRGITHHALRKTLAII